MSNNEGANPSLFDIRQLFQTSTFDIQSPTFVILFLLRTLAKQVRLMNCGESPPAAEAPRCSGDPAG